MPHRKPPTAVVQTSITMEKQLKQQYSKLASSLDLSFSQPVRYALRRVADGYEDYASIEKASEKQDISPTKKPAKRVNTSPAKQ